MHRRISWLLLLSITLSLVPVSLPAPIASFFSLEDLAIQTAHAAEGINRTIHYQGKVSLSGGSSVSNGSYNMRFRIYAASTGGAPLWSETWDSATTRVTMTGGLFSLALGTHTTMTGSVDFNSDSLYLQIEFDPGNDDTYEEVFTPRRRFASVPYAHNAERLAGLLASQFLRSDQPTTASGKLTITAPGLGLDIKGTASGSAIHASTQLSTSGTLVVNGVTTLKNYTSCSLITTDTAGNLGCGTSTVGDLSLSYADSRYVNRSGDTMTGGLLIVNGGDGTQAIEAGLLLEIAGTASGRVLHAQDQLRSSGSLIVAGQSFLQGTLFLQNLLSCTAFATTSSGALQCASAVAGFDQSVTDARYVQIQGDTMTGGLLIVSGGNGSQTIEAGLLLEIGGTASGYILHAQNQLRSSGSLIVEGNAVFDTSTLIVDATNNRVGIGTTTPGRALDILDSSNPQLRLSNSLSVAAELKGDSNGSLVIQGTNTTAIQASLYQQTTPTADVAFAYLNFKANSTQAAGSWTTSYDTTAYAIYSFAFDSTHTVLYAATDNSGIIYRCDPSTSCDASGDWTTSYDSSSSSIVSLLFDSTNGVLYAGAGNGGIIYRCDTSTSCDAGGDWTTSYDSVETSILSLTIDTTHSVLYAGTANAGIIYRCDLITNCDADGDWTTSYDTPDYSILSLTFDAANGILYAGAYNTGSIYRCDTSTNCDASGDWTVSYDTSASYIYALTIDTTHGVLYAGTNNSGIIYRCETSTNCDASGDWTTSYDSPAGSIDSFAFDSVNGVLYAGAHNGDIYSCDTSTSCDAGGDWATSLDTAESAILAVVVDSNNGAVYAGSQGNGIIYRKVIGSTQTSTYAAIQAQTSNSGYSTASGSLVFLTQNRGTLSEGMRLNGFGNLGIGTATPGSRLSVSGSVIIGSNIGSARADTNIALEIAGTASGRILHAQDQLRSSGSLTVQTTGLFKGNLTTRGRLSGATLTVSSNAAISGALLVKGNITTKSAFSGAALTIMAGNSYLLGNVGIGTTTPKAKLDVVGTLSGSSLTVTSLKSCAGLATDTAGALSCAVAGVGSVSTGSLITAFDKRFVNTAGDTMTGGLLIVSTAHSPGTIEAGLLLEIGGAMSGYILHAQNALTSSGMLTVRVKRSTGALIYGSGSNTPTLALDSYYKRAASAHIVFGYQGTFDTKLWRSAARVLNVNGTFSGSTLFASTKLATSGSLVVQTTGLFKGNLTTRGTLSGSALTVTALKSCTSLQTDSNGALSCASQSTGSVSTGSLITAFDKRYVNTSGDTMTGGLLIVSTAHNPGTIEAGLLLEIGGAMSGYILHAQNALTSSGMLTVRVKRSTGALIYGSGSNTPVLALDSYYNSGKAPHIIFGYRGTFDTALWRSGVKQLSLSGSLLPGQSNRFDLGSNTMRWRDLYLSGSSLHIGSSTLEGKIGYRSTGFEGMTFYGGGSVNPAMIISSGGLVGIGTSTPKEKLSVVGTMSGQKLNIGGVDLGEGLNLLRKNLFLRDAHIYLQDSVPTFTTDIYQSSSITYFTNNAGTILLSANTNANTDYTKPALFVNSSNKVGIGTNVIQAKLHVANTAAEAGLFVISSSASNANTVIYQTGESFASVMNVWETDTAQSSSWTFLNAYSDINGTFDAEFVLRGDGQAYADGSWNGGGADLAEYFFVNQQNVPKGTLMTVDRAGQKRVKPAKAGDWPLLGVISTNPGLVANSGGAEETYDRATDPAYALVGLIGQIPTRVSLENGAIAVGDGIAPASVPGVGRKANPGESIVGVAMEPFTGSGANNLAEGKIEVYVGHQSVFPGTGSGVYAYLQGIKSAFTEALTVTLATSTGSVTALQVVSNVGSQNNTVFRADASGNVYADGTFTGGGADYAEWFLSSTNNLQYGEAVCVDTTRSNTVTRCTRSGDLNIIGVVSSPKQAAFIGNKFAGAEGLPVPNTVLVGLVGQLSANMMVESGATIRQGDALAAASIPGYLRKAQPGEASVGIALEELLSGKGFRKILISPRNRSLTAESVSARVEQSIAAMNIQDQVQQKVRDAVTTLGTDGTLLRQVEDQLTTLGVTTLESRIAALEVRVATGATAPTPSSSPVAGEGCPPSTELRTSSGRGGGSCAFTGSLFITGDLTASTLSLDDTLTVGSDARIAGDLYLDGTLNVQSLFIPGIVTIDGALWANTLTIASGAVIRGALDIYHSIQLHSGATVNFASGSILDVSSLIVRNALQVLGPITIGGLAEFLGDVNIQGTLSVSSRQAGFVTVPKTGSSVTILFEHPFATEPVINVTPNGRVGTEWWVEDSSASGFTIRTGWYLQNAVRFSWFAVGIVQTSATGSLQMDTLPSENSPEILSSSSSSSVSSGSSGEVLPVGSAASSVSSASGSGAAVPVMGPVTSSGGAFILPPAAGSSSSVSNGSAASSSAQAAPVVSSSSASAASTSSAAAATSSSAASAVSSAQASSSAEVLPPAAPVSNEPESAPESVPAQTSAPESTPAEVSVPQ